MTKAILRKKVHEYVDKVDEKTLRLLNAMLSEALQIEANDDSLLSNEQIKELERREKSFLAGESKMHTWGKVKSEIRKSYKAKLK